MRVDVDRDLCEANAVCVGIAPDVFSLGGDDTAHVPDGDIPAERQNAVREAVTLCPKVALSLRND
jgi:ferredoxin